jgi:hypothetical protein
MGVIAGAAVAICILCVVCTMLRRSMGNQIEDFDLKTPLLFVENENCRVLQLFVLAHGIRILHTV